jgi:threonine dehydrogenase-like Zn-dependent dehydrogenase
MVDDPVPGPGQVLVAPLACGICGSDLHLLETQAALPDAIPAMVLGHEFVAEVLDAGPGGANRFPPGTVVTSVPYLDTPSGPELIGLSATVVGGLSEMMLLQESRLLPVPAGADADRMALTEPLAVGIHAARSGRMGPGDVALVVGCGPVGLSVVAALKADGFGPVIAADPVPARRRLAEITGADVVLDPGQADPYLLWAGMAGPPVPASPLWTSSDRPSTVVFECVGVPGVLPKLIDSVPVHTRVVVAGVCAQPEPFAPVTAVMKELSLQFVFAYRPTEFETAWRWILDGTVDVGPWITGVRRLGDAATAIGDLRGPDGHCKVLVTPR